MREIGTHNDYDVKMDWTCCTCAKDGALVRQDFGATADERVDLRDVEGNVRIPYSEWGVGSSTRAVGKVPA